MRYHYIQNIEDRLNELIKDTPDNNDRGSFLHWNAFSAPITTRNIKHITSSHTALNFVCYTIAILSVIFFSMGMVISLFIIIDPKILFDYLILGSMVSVMLISGILFFRVSSHAKEIVQFSWDTAHENQKIRLSTEKEKIFYPRKKIFAHLLKYFFYPKTQDIQKPILLIIGFVFYFLSINTMPRKVDLFHLAFVMFVFEFLAYQARYQINDIRGIKEDKEMGHENRLITREMDNVGRIILLSLYVAVIKIVVALILIIFWGKDLRYFLLVCLGILFCSMFFYETARYKKTVWPVFLSVGIGYPLRFFVGFFASAPIKWKLVFRPSVMCFIIAILLYGS